MERTNVAIIGMMNGLVEGITEANMAPYGQVIENMGKSQHMESPETFDVFIVSTVEEILTASVSEYLAKKYPTLDQMQRDKLVEVYIQFQLLEEQLAGIIKIKEPGGCEHDKSGYLINSYMEFVISGDMPFDTDEAKFWKPKFGTGQKWINMIYAILHLKSGKVEEYAEALAAVLNEGSEA